MDKKLLLRLTNRTTWRLLCKASALPLILLVVVDTRFAWWAVVGFFSAAGIVYFSELKPRSLFGASYWILIALSLVATNVRHGGARSGILIIIFGFYLLSLLLLTRSFFKEHSLIYGIYNTATLLVLFLAFFYFSDELPRFLAAPFLFVGTTLLLREAFGSAYDMQWKKRIWGVSGAVGLLTVEMGSLLRFLPLGFINAAAFLTLLIIILRDSIIVHFQGKLGFPFIVRELSFLVFLTLIVFAVSPWSL